MADYLQWMVGVVLRLLDGRVSHCRHGAEHVTDVLECILQDSVALREAAVHAYGQCCRYGRVAI